MQHRPPAAEGKPSSRQVVRYAVYRLSPEWRRLDGATRDAGKREFAAVIGEHNDRMMIRPYSLTATRGDADFMLWTVANSLDDFQSLYTGLARTGLGKYATIPYSYFAMTRRSIYIDKHTHEGQEGARLKIRPGGAKFLFVYPFVKSREWYALPMADRQRMMDEHIAVGHKYPGIRINTSYSFGLDDQEFVVAFEGDNPSEFLDLVMELRDSQASCYTIRDTPSFTAAAMPLDQLLATL
ncbi:MAG: chlorite dismutase family protein [Chloroflexi bacterium]|nr:chlorite dismutase family protein [Chloroflexota bacterium]